MPRDSLKAVLCAVCSSNNTAKIGIDNSYEIVRCRNCSFVYVNPRPTSEQLVRMYRYYYPKEDDVSPRKWENEMRKIFFEICDWITNWKPNGKLLDVGCSYGHLLKEMKRRGWTTVGIEPSEVATNYAKEHGSGLIHQGSFETLDLEPESFDAVVSLYVMEHVYDPREFLNKIYRILKREGKAIIRIPHTSPLFHINRLLKRSLMDAPMHLNDFSPDNLRSLAHDIGFNNVDVRIGKTRNSREPIEHVGAVLLGGFGRLLELISRGKLLFPLSGAFTYYLHK